MKIALYHNLTSGGSKRELFEFAREFHRRGHTLDLYRPASANEEFLPLSPYVRKDRVFPMELGKRMRHRLPGLRNHINVLRTFQTLRRTENMSRIIASEIDGEGYDFAFLHHDRIVQSPYVGRYLKTTSVYFCAEPMRRFYEPRISRTPTKRPDFQSRLAESWYSPSQMALERAIKRIDQRNLKPIDILLTNSYFSNETIYRAYGRRASVVHLGVDTDKFTPDRSKTPRRVILSVGAVAPLKGYDFLIRAVGLLPLSKRLPVIIVGNTASESEVTHLKKLASLAGVDIDFRVNLSEEELVTLYQTAWVYAYTPVMEPMGLSPLEALACGIPVVAVSEGGVRETMRCPTAAILTERFEMAFSEALAETINRRDGGVFNPEHARRHILSYWTWPHACERMFSALRQVGLVSE